jgi:hypothetical protein
MSFGLRTIMTTIGAAICGALVFGIWPEMWKSYGIMGGWLAGPPPSPDASTFGSRPESRIDKSVRRFAI